MIPGSMIATRSFIPWDRLSDAGNWVVVLFGFLLCASAYSAYLPSECAQYSHPDISRRGTNAAGKRSNAFSCGSAQITGQLEVIRERRVFRDSEESRISLPGRPNRPAGNRSARMKAKASQIRRPSAFFRPGDFRGKRRGIRGTGAWLCSRW